MPLKPRKSTDENFDKFHSFGLSELSSSVSAEQAAAKEGEENESDGNGIHGDEDFDVDDECIPRAPRGIFQNQINEIKVPKRLLPHQNRTLSLLNT